MRMSSATRTDAAVPVDAHALAATLSGEPRGQIQPPDVLAELTLLPIDSQTD
jgi:hypothetical protein